MATRIGFIGLGTMGRPMALNLLEAGHKVRVYNRTRSKMESLVIAGAEAADSYKDAVSGAAMVITMLSDSPDVREVILGPDGALAGCAAGAVIVDMSTISPSVAAEIAQACRDSGVEFLDAPVTGGEAGAVNGTLSIMVGGECEALDSVRDVLGAMGSKITYMGPSGSGQSAKLCNQVICALNILAVCEGLTLAESAGLDGNTLLEAVGGGAAGSWMVSNLGPKMLAEDWAPGFRIALQQKDLRLALGWAAERQLPMFGTALVQQVFRNAEASGLGDEGTQALIKAVRSLSGRG
jgi:3-hydroxyisobutyrate dehydrogenase-like beta-hydroxyacid dehydrogenase